MRLLAGVSQTTLDSFHREVYRPRMALTLLILLLVVARQHPAQNKERTRPPPIGHAAGNADGQGRTLKETAYSALLEQKKAKSSWFDFRGRQHRVTFVDLKGLDGEHTKDGVGQRVKDILRSLPDEASNSRSSLAFRWMKGKKDRRQPNEASYITQDRLSKNSDTSSADVSAGQLETLRNRLRSLRDTPKDAPVRRRPSSHSTIANVLNADTLSALTSLHALWIIRLGSMVLEDFIGKESFDRASLSFFDRRKADALVIAWIAISCLLALFASVHSWADLFHRWGCVRDANGFESMASIRAIIFMELSATLFSLAAPLSRLRDPRLSRVFPIKMTIPSPSHSPSIVDLLPIPAAWKEAYRVREMRPQPPFDPLPSLPRTMGLGGRHRTAFRRTGLEGNLTASPISHGDLTGAAAAFRARERELTVDQVAQQRTTTGQDNLSQSQPSSSLAEPLRWPRQGKAPRLRGMRVRVDTNWMIENAVTLYSHTVGALQFAVVTVALPTLNPTSFPSLLSLLSLRAQLGAITSTWTQTRSSIECLEFVRRRWCHNPLQTPDKRGKAEEVAVCAICFENVQLSSLGEAGESDMDESKSEEEDCCTLDCGHQLHSICLVQWLSKQAFCPCCHAVLKATPPQAPSGEAVTST